MLTLGRLTSLIYRKEKGNKSTTVMQDGLSFRVCLVNDVSWIGDTWCSFSGCKSVALSCVFLNAFGVDQNAFSFSPTEIDVTATGNLRQTICLVCRYIGFASFHNV